MYVFTHIRVHIYIYIYIYITNDTNMLFVSEGLLSSRSSGSGPPAKAAAPVGWHYLSDATCIHIYIYI